MIRAQRQHSFVLNGELILIYLSVSQGPTARHPHSVASEALRRPPNPAIPKAGAPIVGKLLSALLLERSLTFWRNSMLCCQNR